MDDLVGLMMMDMTTKDDRCWWYFDSGERASRTSRMDEGTMLPRRRRNICAVVDGT